MSEYKRRHYWIYAAQILFKDSKGDYQRSLNTLLPTDNKYVTRKDLARAQEATQVKFFQKTFPENQIPIDVQVVDLFTVSISYLGFMSQKEFNEGFAEAEQAAEATKQ